jgi:hypothetical protein
MLNTNGKMKTRGYILLLLCFIWSVVIFILDGDYEIIKFWVNIAMLLIFGNTAKHLIGEKLKGKVNE